MEAHMPVITGQQSDLRRARIPGLRRLAGLAALTIAASAPISPVHAGDIDIGRAGATVCAGCHGMDGISIVPGFPNLRGQDQTYLEAQLKNFRDESRTGGQSVIMYGMAAGLSDEDIENLAAYFSSLGNDGE